MPLTKSYHFHPIFLSRACKHVVKCSYANASNFPGIQSAARNGLATGESLWAVPVGAGERTLQEAVYSIQYTVYS